MKTSILLIILFSIIFLNACNHKNKKLNIDKSKHAEVDTNFIKNCATNYLKKNYIDYSIFKIQSITYHHNCKCWYVLYTRKYRNKNWTEFVLEINKNGNTKFDDSYVNDLRLSAFPNIRCIGVLNDETSEIIIHPCKENSTISINSKIIHPDKLTDRMEDNNEIGGPLIYNTNNDSVMIACLDQNGEYIKSWINKSYFKKIIPIEEFYTNDKFYLLTPEWDGKLFKSSNFDSGTITLTPYLLQYLDDPRHVESPTVTIKLIQKINGLNWYYVNLYGSESDKSVITGWMPLLNANKQIMFWPFMD